MPGWDPYRLLYRHTIGPTALTRRELFEDLGGYDVDIARAIVMGYEDWEFWLHAVARGWHGVKVPRGDMAVPPPWHHDARGRPSRVSEVVSGATRQARGSLQSPRRARS